jgi:hypothetical protein
VDQFGKGDVVHITWTLRNNASGVLVDASEQIFKFIDPTSTQTNITYTDGVLGIVHDGTGSYYYDLPVGIPGMWWTRIEVGGSNQGEAEYRFEVRATRFV